MNANRGYYARRDGMEVPPRRRQTQRIEIEPGLREGGTGAGLGHPTRERDARRMRLIELELLDRP